MADQTYREVNRLDLNFLSSALGEAIAQEPDAEIISVAQEISPMCAGRNAEFVAIGFAAAYQYFMNLNGSLLDEREELAVLELMQLQGLSRKAVIKQGLRLFQLHVKGAPDLGLKKSKVE